VMMCIINPEYVIGACISAYAHGKYLKEAGRYDDTDLVIMCDAQIYYEYFNTLIKFFHKVILIEPIHKHRSDKYKFPPKYRSWIEYSLTKWKVLSLMQYMKVLFVDITVMPVDAKLYDCLDTDNIEIIVRHKINYDIDICMNNEYKVNFNVASYGDYCNQFARSEMHNNLDASIYGTMEGSFLCIKPSLELYNQYISFIDTVYSDGLYSIYSSTPDETSMFYFLHKYHLDKVNDVCHIHSLVPWDNREYIPQSYAFRFTSMLKPWTKPRIICWDEEILWHDIYDKLQRDYYGHKNTILDESLNELYENTLIDKMNFYKKYSKSKRYKKSFNDIRTEDVEAFLLKKFKISDINVLENKFKNETYGDIHDKITIFNL
jgi:hypothetical protein